ncbi:MAG: TPM domain-containing protein [Cytophagaceae bacterium]
MRQLNHIFCWGILVGMIFQFHTTLASYPNRFSTVTHVNDYAAMFTPKEHQHLESVCSAFLDSTGNELVILTVQSVSRQSIQSYADSVVNQWTQSTKQLDVHGYWVLIVVSKSTKEYVISVGSQLQPRLNELAISRIEASYLKPYFEKEHFEAGLVTSIKAMEGIVEGKQTADDLDKSPYGIVLILLGITFFFYMFVIPLFQYQVFKHNNLGSKPVNFVTGMMISYGQSFIAHRSYDDFVHNVGVFKTDITFQNGGNGVVGKW